MTNQTTETEEFETLRHKIRQKADAFGTEEFQERSANRVPISNSWDEFQGGPVRAKWVPTDEHNCTLILFEIPAGVTIDFHDHRPTESLIVVGDVRLYTPEESYRLKTGDVMRIKGLQAHAAEFYKDSLLTIMWSPAFSPDPEAPTEQVLYQAGGFDVRKEEDEQEPVAN